jgi:hypothetical protein
MRSRVLERRFRRDGYVITPVAPPEVLARALEVFQEYDSGITEGYYASIHSPDNGYKAKVDAALSEILWPHLDALLHEHRSLIAAFMVKPPTGPTVVPLHQDWNTKDESDGAGITCWIPLTPISDVEGRMRVLPGSHRYMQNLRGSPGFPAPYQQISDRIRDELTVTLDVQVGEVLIMDGRVLHTTDQNESGRMRVCAYINALPADARTLHYYLGPDGVVEAFWVDESFYTNFHIGDRPPGEPFLTIPEYEAEEITMEDLLGRMRSARPRFGRRPRLTA